MMYRRGAIKGRSFSFTAFLLLVLLASAFALSGPGVVPAAHAAAAHASVAQARIEEGVKEVGPRDAARFKVDAPADQASEFAGRCTLSAVGGSVSVAVDGVHYVPLSAPAIGDVLTLQPGESRTYEMTGTFAPNERGDAEIAFIFNGSPAGFCFPGQQCAKAAESATALRAECTNR